MGHDAITRRQSIPLLTQSRPFGYRLSVSGVQLTKTLGATEAQRQEWTRHWISTGFDSLEKVLADNPSRGFYEHLGGLLAGDNEIVLGGARLKELAYVWPD